MIIPFAFVLLITLIVVTLFTFVMVRDLRLSKLAAKFQVPLSFSDVLAMRFKKIDPRAVVDALVLAQQHNLDIAVSDVEAAYMRGADVEKAVFNLTATHAGQGSVTIEELLEAGSQE